MSNNELYHIFSNGLESQRAKKRELFYREAQRWADWWEKNAAKFVQGAAYAHVNLPPPPATAAKAPAAGTHYKTTGASTNWLLESIFDPKATRSFYDLDTGRVAGLPEKWRKAQDIEPLMDEILAWAAREGFDLMGTEHTTPDGRRYYALRSIALQAWELGPDRWKWGSNDFTVESLKAEGTPCEGLLFHAGQATGTTDPAAIAPFLYVTHQGTPGLLFVGIEVNDDGAKPGGRLAKDPELDPVAINKGRRFGYTEFEEVK